VVVVGVSNDDDPEVEEPEGVVPVEGRGWPDSRAAIAVSQASKEKLVEADMATGSW